MNKSLKFPKSPKIISSGVKDELTVVSLGALVGNIVFPGIGGIVAGIVSAKVVLEIKKDKVMNKIPVFYSFHFANDVMRVQQIRQIGAIEGNSPVNPNEWEKLKQNGSSRVERWIDENMKYKRCVVVLIGSETSRRPWVRYEIVKAWNDGKALLGIYIHDLNCPRSGRSRKGDNPFGQIKFKDGRRMSSVIPCYEPNRGDAYSDISTNIRLWIDSAIQNKRN